MHNQIVVLESGTILIFYDYVYRSIDGGHSFTPIFQFDNQRSTPFVQGIAVDKNDNVYFGEYDCTIRPHNIQIFKGSKDGAIWEVAYEFPAGDIFHIHSIRYDPFRDRLWICSGDRDEESRLMYTDDEFQTVQTLGDGDQGWRIVSLIIDEDYLYWGSDNDRDGSYIYRYNFDAHVREKIQFVGKPSYFSTQLEDGTLVINTTYEPASPFTRNFAPEPTTDVWISKNGLDWHQVIKLPHHVFKTASGEARASIIFPGGAYESRYLYMSPQSTAEYEFTTLKYEIQWEN